MKNLEELKNEATQLKNLPETMGGLESLLSLSLGMTEITSLPQGLAELPALQRVSVMGSPIDPADPVIARLHARGIKVKTKPGKWE